MELNFGQILPVAMTALGAFMGKQGNDQAADAARVQGEARRVAAQFQADQLRDYAGQSVASAQRGAIEEKRKATLLASRAVAVAAASGGAADPGVLSTLARISSEGAYRASVSLYRGEEEARRARLAAAGKEYEGAMAVIGGEQAAASYETAGMGALLKGGASLFAKYGQGGPDKVDTAPKGDLASGASVDLGAWNWAE